MVTKIVDCSKIAENIRKHWITGLGVNGHYTPKQEIFDIVNNWCRRRNKKVNIQFVYPNNNRFFPEVLRISYKSLIFSRTILEIEEVSSWGLSDPLGCTNIIGPYGRKLHCYWDIVLKERDFRGLAEELAKYLTKKHAMDAKINLRYRR